MNKGEKKKKKEESYTMQNTKKAYIRRGEWGGSVLSIERRKVT